ncbi:hypothetical protein D3C75_512690 [compost metagenome]
MHFFAVDAVEGRHDGLCACRDRRWIPGRVDAHQVCFADPGITLVLTVGGAAVAEEVLHRSDHMTTIEERGRTHFALQAFDHCTGIAGHHLGRFGIALVSTPPAVVLRYCHGRCECPLHAGRAGLQCGDFADPAQQIRVAGRAQADVVREQRRADDVALPVHGINAEQHRNRFATGGGVHRRCVERIGQRQPFGRRGIVTATGIGIAAGQDRAQPIAAHVVGRDAGDIALHQLADLFLHRHGGHQVGDALLQRGVLGQRPGDLRPRIRRRGRRSGNLLILAAGRQCQQQRGQQHASMGAANVSMGHCVHPCICSSSLPLVSCTYLSTKNTEMTAATR